MKLNEKINSFTDNHRGAILLFSTIVTIFAAIFTALTVYQNNQLAILQNNIETPKSKRDFAVALEYNNPMVTKKDDGSKLSIYYDGVEVENPYTVMISFENTGLEPIEVTDFLQPLSIVINKDANILDYYVASSSSNHLSSEVYESIQIKENTLSSKGFFINQNEKVAIAFVTDKKASNFTVNNRFYGIPNIKIYNNPQQRIEEKNELIESQKELAERARKNLFAIGCISTILVSGCIILIICEFLKIKKKKKKTLEIFYKYGIDLNAIKRKNRFAVFVSLLCDFDTCKRLNYDEEKTKEILLGTYNSMLQVEHNNDK